METFSRKLMAELDSWHLLKHPFYEAWNMGSLDRETLKTYATRYYPHVLAFPRYVSAVHSRCEDAAARAELARNLADEEGVSGAGLPHPELWLRFAEGLGASRDEVEAAPRSPAAHALVETFFSHCRSGYAAGLGALFAYERQIPEIARTKADGLQRHYGVTEARSLEFFTVHETADQYHSQAVARALDALSLTEQEQARAGAIASARALWDFMTEAYAPAAA